MSQALGEHGNIGTERLCMILNRFFSQLIESLMAFGCDILKFAGDALLLYWPCGQRRVDTSTTHPPLRRDFESKQDYQDATEVFEASGLSRWDSIKEATVTATAQLISICNKVETFRSGDFHNVLGASEQNEARQSLSQEQHSLYCHAGLAVGHLTFHILGGLKNRHELLVASPVMKEIGAALDKSEVKEVVSGPSAWSVVSHLCSPLDVEDRGDGHKLVRKVEWQCGTLDPRAQPHRDTPSHVSDPRVFAVARTFIPSPMRSYLNYAQLSAQLWCGEFRDIVVLFAGFTPTGTLQDLFYNVQEVRCALASLRVLHPRTHTYFNLDYATIIRPLDLLLPSTRVLISQPPFVFPRRRPCHHYTDNA
jgi:hypothetical protein